MRDLLVVRGNTVHCARVRCWLIGRDGLHFDPAVSPLPSRTRQVPGLLAAKVWLDWWRHADRQVKVTLVSSAFKTVGEMDFGAGVPFPAAIPKAYTNRNGPARLEIENSPAERLRPEVFRFVPATGDRPILDQSLPGLATIERCFDLIEDIRVRWVARQNVSSGVGVMALAPGRVAVVTLGVLKAPSTMCVWGGWPRRNLGAVSLKATALPLSRWGMRRVGLTNESGRRP